MWYHTGTSDTKTTVIINFINNYYIDSLTLVNNILFTLFNREKDQGDIMFLIKITGM